MLIHIMFMNECIHFTTHRVIAGIAVGSLLFIICVLTCCICGWTYYIDKRTECCRSWNNFKHKYKTHKRKAVTTPFQKPLERTEQPPSYTSVFPEHTLSPGELTEKEKEVEIEKIEMAVPLAEEQELNSVEVAEAYKWSTTV